MSQAAAQPEKKPRRRVKKVKGHGGHHGGAWKVAYADFVTAMMALFLVLWLVSQADTKLKAAIANYFRSPGAFATVAGGVLEGQQKMSKEPQQTNAKLEEQMLTDVAQFLRKQFLDRPEFADYKNQIKIRMTEDGLEIDLVDEGKKFSFASGNAELSPQAKAILQVIAQGICQMPNQIKIAGYTDSQAFPAGSTYTNWELSTDRANAARRVLEETCVAASQINAVVGYADSRPARPDEPLSPENRRISILLLKGDVAAEEGGEVDPNSVMEPAAKKGGDAAKLEPSMDSDGEPVSEPAAKGAKGDAAEKAAAADAKGEATNAAGVRPKSEAEAARHKLQTEGAVSVGEPDVVPSGASRVREQPVRRGAQK